MYLSLITSIGRKAAYTAVKKYLLLVIEGLGERTE